jgi:hypothetical protein
MVQRNHKVLVNRHPVCNGIAVILGRNSIKMEYKVGG